MSPMESLVREKRGFVIWPLFKNVSYRCQITSNRKRGVSWSFWWSDDPWILSQSWDIFWCNLTPLIVIWQVSCYISMIEEISRIILRPNAPTQDKPTQRYRCLKFDPFLFWSVWLMGIRLHVGTPIVHCRQPLRSFWYIVCWVDLLWYDL